MGLFNAPRAYPEYFEPYYDQFNFYDGRDAWLKSVESIPEEAVNLFSVHWLHLEVYNGGFDQYFFNSTGTSAPEALRGFQAIGMPKVADVVEAAMKVLGKPYPCASTEERRDRLERLPEDDHFGEFDERSYELADTKQFFRKLPKFVPYADRYATRA